jgi:acetoacetyl-CoA reductase
MVAAHPREILEKLLKGRAGGQLVRASEIARTVRLLVDDDAGYITRSVISVNGGLDM